MNDAMWDLFCKIFDADTEFGKYYDRLRKIYDEVPVDIRADFSLIKNRLQTAEDIRKETNKLLTKIKEAILL